MMSVVPQCISCSNGSSFFPNFIMLCIKYKYCKAPFLLREVSLFAMAFVTAALAHLIASVGILSNNEPRGFGN